MPRPFPYPPEQNTVHLIGDLHFGPSSSGISTARSDVIKNDILQSPLLPRSIMRLQAGDCTEQATSQDTADFNAWKSNIPGEFKSVIGNHDIQGNSRTSDAAFAAYGLGDRTWVEDMGSWMIIGLSPPQMIPGFATKIHLTNDELNFLTYVLAANASKPAVIIAHAPLWNTVLEPGGAPEGEYTSLLDDFYLHPSSHDAGPPVPNIESILNTYSNAKVILSGHTHSSMGVQGFIKTHNLGTRSILTINASAVFYTGVGRTNDPIRTMFLTFKGSTVEIRVRDHINRCFIHTFGSKVATFTVPA